MPKKRVKSKVYALLALRLRQYSAHVDASINAELHMPAFRYDGTRIYSFDSRIELAATAYWPEERAGEEFALSIYGLSPYDDRLPQTLKDCQERDEKGALRFRKVRGELRPVYDVPEGIGILNKVRGTQNWTGAAWVAPNTISDMLTLLPTVDPLYVFLHEVKIGRNRWIKGITLQTTDPAEE